eukprot:6471593-Amphidinium_carterae.1
MATVTLECTIPIYVAAHTAHLQHALILESTFKELGANFYPKQRNLAHKCCRWRRCNKAKVL